MKVSSCRTAAAVFVIAGVLCWIHQAFRGPEWDRELGIIMRSPTVDESAVGYAGQRTETYAAYETLRQEASRERLLEWTRAANPNLRAYASKALRSRFPEESFFELLMERIDDEQTIDYLSGCIRSRQSLAYFYFRLFSSPLSGDQRLTLITHVLKKPDNHEVRAAMLNTWKMPEEFLPRLRELASQGEGRALTALAGFRKAEDYPLIMASVATLPYESYQCMAMNPQPVYFPLLLAAHASLLAEKYRSTTQRQFYAAVAAFRSEATVALFERVMDGSEKEIPMREDQLNFIYQAVSPYPDPVFDALKWRFWEELRIVDLPTFTRLSAMDAERASDLTRTSLDHLSWELSDELLGKMLTKESQRDPGYVVELIASELGKGDVSRYEFFANLAKLSKERRYVEPLFHALETADNPNVYLRATGALLAYNDGVIRQRILAAPANNKAITQGWGGEEFRNLVNPAHGR